MNYAINKNNLAGCVVRWSQIRVVGRLCRRRLMHTQILFLFRLFFEFLFFFSSIFYKHSCCCFPVRFTGVLYPGTKKIYIDFIK